MRASPALLRARAPYLIKNTITGTAIVGLVIGICANTTLLILYILVADVVTDAYTIRVISQDEFEDVVVPPEPIKRSDGQSATDAVRKASEARKHIEQ
jgi:cytochrome c oxidase assembly factor 3